MEVLDQIRQSILKNHPEWSSAKAEDIQIARMTGITNQTYKAWVNGQGYRPIIYRKFGQTGENPFLQRDSEIHVYKDISKAGFGPAVYYFDEKIRIQQFIESTVLSPKQMLKQGRLEEVAFTLRKFHQLKPSSPEIGKHSLFNKVFVNGQGIVGSCHKKMAQPIYTPKEQQILEIMKKWITPEQVQFIKKATEPYEQQLVFSHNDLLANNILIDASGKTVFIDYEYACYNYPIFDIANYFNESQLDYDVTEEPFFSIIPTKQEDIQNQKKFIEAYVIAKDLTLEQFREKLESLRKQEKYQGEINKLVSDLPLGRMLSSVMWGWWGVLVCKNPLINFDYLAFSKWRYEQYSSYKAGLLK